MPSSVAFLFPMYSILSSQEEVDPMLPVGRANLEKAPRKKFATRLVLGKKKTGEQKQHFVPWMLKTSKLVVEP